MVRTCDVGLVRPFRTSLQVSSVTRNTICSLPPSKRSRDETTAREELFSALVACLRPGDEKNRGVEISRSVSPCKAEGIASFAHAGSNVSEGQARSRVRPNRFSHHDRGEERRCSHDRGHNGNPVAPNSMSSARSQKPLYTSGSANVGGQANLRAGFGEVAVSRPRPKFFTRGFASTLLSHVGTMPMEEARASVASKQSRGFTVVPEYREVLKKRMGRGPKARRVGAAWADEISEETAEVVAASPVASRIAILEVPLRQRHPLVNYRLLSPMGATSRGKCLHEDSPDMTDESARMEQAGSCGHCSDPLAVTPRTITSNSVESISSQADVTKEILATSIIEATAQFVGTAQAIGSSIENEKMPRSRRLPSPASGENSSQEDCETA